MQASKWRERRSPVGGAHSKGWGATGLGDCVWQMMKDYCSVEVAIWSDLTAKRKHLEDLQGGGHVKSFHFSLYNCRCSVVYNCTRVRITEQGCSIGLLVLGLSFLKLTLLLGFRIFSSCHLWIGAVTPQKRKGKRVGSFAFWKEGSEQAGSCPGCPPLFRN